MRAVCVRAVWGLLVVTALAGCQKPNFEATISPTQPLAAAAQGEVIEGLRKRIETYGGKLHKARTESGTVVISAHLERGADKKLLTELLVPGVLTLHAIDDKASAALINKSTSTLPTGLHTAGYSQPDGNTVPYLCGAEGVLSAWTAAHEVPDRTWKIDTKRGRSCAMLLGPPEPHGKIEYSRVFQGGPEGPPSATFELDDEGKKAFLALSTRLVGWRLAIILDGTVHMAPVVQTPIEGGSFQLTLGGGLTRLEAIQRARILSAIVAAPLPGAPWEVTSFQDLSDDDE